MSGPVAAFANRWTGTRFPLLSSATTEVRTESALRPLLKASTRLWLMNVLILAAGYATRLYPLTLNKAKPLLEIAGKPMIERIVEQLGSVDRLGIIYVVTNAKFAAQFEAWAPGVQSRHAGLRIKIINDESTSDADKLGAIGDIRLVLQKSDASRDDLIVIAGDNLFSEPIDGFIEFARGKEAAVAVFDVGSREAIKKYASVSLNQEGVITRFEEKPQDPKSTLAALALYFYSRGVL